VKVAKKNHLSIVLGAVSICSLLWASVLFAQQNERAESPAAEPSAEQQAVDHLKGAVTDLLEVLLTEFPTDKVLVNLVPELPYLYHPAKAAALLEYALEHNPSNSMLCRLMAAMAFDTGDYEKALTYFRKTSELSREPWKIRNRIAESLIALGRYQEVVDSLEEKDEDPVSPGRSDYLLGQAFTQLGNYIKARECYEKALKSDPQNSQYAYALGEVYMRLNKPGEAKPYLEAFREKQAAHKRGALETAKKRREPIVHHAAIPMPWERGEIAYILSVTCVRGSKLYRESGRAERAERVLKKGQEALQKAIELAPEQPDPYRELARLYLLPGKSPSKAARLAEQAVALEPSAQNYLALGHAYRANKEHRKAISALRKTVDLESEWPNAKSELAWILATHADAAVRRPAEAVRIAEQAATLVKYRNPYVLKTLAAAYASAGQFGRAARVAEHVLEMVRATNDEALTADIGKQLELYKKEKPYRESD
jgi:tetratricopeptide (TPR) repeat protein